MEKKSKINSTRPYQNQMRPEMAAQTCPGPEQTQSYLVATPKPRLSDPSNDYHHGTQNGLSDTEPTSHRIKTPNVHAHSFFPADRCILSLASPILRKRSLCVPLLWYSRSSTDFGSANKANLRCVGRFFNWKETRYRTSESCWCASLWLCLCATSVDGPTLPSSSSSLSGSVIEMPEIPGTTWSDLINQVLYVLSQNKMK